MSDFVNAKNMKLALLLGAIAVLAVSCDDGELTDQQDVLNTVLSLDTPRTVLTYGVLATSFVTPLLIGRHYYDRVAFARVNFGICGVIWLLSFIPFAKNFIDGRKHAMYLTSLIVCLAPTLAAGSFALMSTGLNKYAPKEYAELLFKKVAEKKNDPPRREKEIITEKLDAVKSALDVLQAKAKDQNGPKIDTNDVAAVLKSLEAARDLMKDDLLLSDHNSLYNGILEKCGELKNLISDLQDEVKKVTEFMDELETKHKLYIQKQIKVSYDFLKEFKVPSTKSTTFLSEVCDHFDNLLRNGPRDDDQQQQTASPVSAASEKEIPMKEKEPSPVAGATSAVSPQKKEPSSEEMTKMEMEKKGAATASPSAITASSVPAKEVKEEKKDVVLTGANCKNVLNAVGVAVCEYVVKHFSEAKEFTDTEINDLSEFFRSSIAEFSGQYFAKKEAVLGTFRTLRDKISEQAVALKEKQEKAKAEKLKKDLAEKKKKEGDQDESEPKGGDNRQNQQQSKIKVVKSQDKESILKGQEKESILKGQEKESILKGQEKESILKGQGQEKESILKGQGQEKKGLDSDVKLKEGLKGDVEKGAQSGGQKDGPQAEKVIKDGPKVDVNLADLGKPSSNTH